MALLVRCKIVQYFSTLSRNYLFSRHTRSFQCPVYIEKYMFTKSYCTQLSQDSNLDRRLRRLDQDVRRLGRVTKREVEDIFQEIRVTRSATGTQSLFLIRCCGLLLNEEHPHMRTRLVEDVWNTLNNFDVPLDVSHYNALLRVYLENEHPFSPTEFLSDLESKGIEPNTVTYQRLVERYCQEGDIEGATHILEFMRVKQLPVNENIFNALILGHSEAGDMESAADILNVMKHAGLEPSSRTYTTLLCAYGKHGDIVKLREVMKECKENDIYFLNKDYMDILYSLAVNNHHQYVEEILEMIQHTVGYNQDTLNLILRLINKKQFSVAKMMFFSLPQRQDLQKPQGNFFIKQIVKAECPIQEILALCEEMKQTGLNDRAYYTAIETALVQGQTEKIYTLLQILKEDGHPIRQHYFWPFIVSLGRANDSEGILQVLEIMRRKFEITVLGETLRDYVVPWLLKQSKHEPNELVSKLQLAGVSEGDAVSSIVHNLLSENNISCALKLLRQCNVHFNSAMLKKPLIQAYQNTKDVESFAEILRIMYEVSEGIGISKIKTPMNEESDIIDRHEFLGQLVLDAVTSVKDKSFIVKLLNALANEGLQISNSIAERLVEKIGEESLTPEISNMLEKLTRGEDTYNLQKRTTPSDLYRERELLLKRLLKQNQLKDGKTSAIKKQLMSIYCKNEDFEAADRLWKELREEGIILGPGLAAQLIDLYVSKECLEKALDLYTFSKTHIEDFSLDRVKVIKVVNLFVNNNDIDGAINFLTENHREKLEESTYAFNALCRELLNNLAAQGEANSLTKLFNALVKNNYLEVNNSMLGPLVNVHIIRDDLDGALKQFEECFTQYRCTPSKKYLTCKLIEAEDAVGLQKLTNLSTRVHGEVNSLYDLVFAFVECGRIRQARKILEIPGLLSRPERVQSACKRYSLEGNVSTLEGLIEATKSITHIDQTDIFQHLLLSYCKKGDAKCALDLWVKMQDENILPTDQLLIVFGNFLKEKGLHVPFSIPQVTNTNTNITPKESSTYSQLPSLKEKFKNTLTNGQIRECLEIFQRMGSEDRKAITKSKLSFFLDGLIKMDQITDSLNIFLDLAKLGIFPLTPTSKRILNKIASLGDLDNLISVGKYLNEDLKMRLLYYNSLCKAYVAAGKSQEYLDGLEKEIDNEKNDIIYLNNTFPLYGSLDLLQNSPQHESQFRNICEKYLNGGSSVPFNTLWMYYVINNQYSTADELWNQCLSSSQTVKYHVVCRIAKDNGDISMAKYVVDKLQNSLLLDSDKVVAYSTVLDILLSKDMKTEAIQFYTETRTVVPNNVFSDPIVLKLHNAAKELGTPLNDCS